MLKTQYILSTILCGACILGVCCRDPDLPNDPPEPSSKFPPAYDSYRFVILLGNVNRNSNIVASQGYPRGAVVKIVHGEEIFMGNPDKVYLVNSYSKDKLNTEITGHVIYEKIADEQ